MYRLTYMFAQQKMYESYIYIHTCKYVCALLQLSLLFDALEAVLLRTAADLKKYKALGDAIARSVLSFHLPAVYTTLAMSNSSSQIKSATKLLTALVIQGRSQAKDVLLHFDFSHRNVYPLLNRRDTKVQLTKQ